MAYSPPSSAKPYTLSIPDDQLNELKTLLKASKLGPDTWECRQEDRRFGATREWLSNAKDYWLNKYDWRAQEKRINSFPNYTMEIEGLDVHFIGLFSSKKDAIPLIFMHGWPGSFIEFIPMMELVRKQFEGKDLPYHIVVPSLPGYTLSSGPPKDRGWTTQDSARIFNTLMKNLGFSKYVAQGGDVGYFLAHHMVVEYENCVAAHMNMFSVRNVPEDVLPTLTADEKSHLEKGRQWRETGCGYAIMHGTRPSTISLVLSSSPLAVLAWIGEKMLEWSDTDPSIDTILTNVSLYWFTEGFPRSIYPYRRLFGEDSKTSSPLGNITKPFGYSYFPKEIFPGPKALIEKQGNCVHFVKHDKGGHFAALEQPELLWGDVEAFVGKAWK